MSKSQIKRLPSLNLESNKKKSIPRIKYDNCFLYKKSSPLKIMLKTKTDDDCAKI